MGIREHARFRHDDSADLASRVCDDAPWDQPRDSDRYRPWGELASPSVHECDDGIVDSRERTEIRHDVPGRAATKG